MPSIFPTHYRGVLYDKNGDRERREEVIRTLKHAAAEYRRPLNAFFDARTPRAPNCFGREAELARIASHFLPVGAADPVAALAASPPRDSRRILIQAGPGFGKTTLAAHFARSHRDDFTGFWWIPSQDRTTLLAAVMAIARPSEHASAPTPERARELLAQRFQDTVAPLLLVFDNVGALSEDAGPQQPAIGADALPQGTEALVADLAGSLPTNVRVLMTSRRPGWDDGAELIELKALVPEPAADFLRKRAHRQDDAAGSLRLAKSLGGLPLALDHAGAYCARTECSFDEYRDDLLYLRSKAPPGVEYDKTVFATTTMGLQQACKISEDPEAVTRLADFLSYCAADRIPRTLCRLALDGHRPLADEAIGALRDVGLLHTAEAYADRERAVGVHRLVQRIIRDATDAAGRSNAVISRLVPFLCEQLAGTDEDGAVADNKSLRVQKYMPQLFQALPHLDAPDFRGTEAANLLDQVAKLVVLSLKEQEIAGDAEIPEHLPKLLGCFYEVDPLAEPLDFLLKRMSGQPKAWAAFRDACLNEGNYVLRFALSTALADAIEDPASHYSLKDATALVEKPQSLNHFELGGYALKSYYSKRIDAKPEASLLRRLAAHPCYPGRSILGDLMLNLVYRQQTPSALLPSGEGDNHRFWKTHWDFVAYDVNAIVAAEYVNRGTEPSVADGKPVCEEFEYRRSLQDQCEKLRGELDSAPIQKLVEDYFKIGADPKRLARIDEEFAALGPDLLTRVLRLFFGHPLWSVAETAANVIARLYSSAAEAKDTGACDGYHAVIVELLDRSEPWRVRFGATEAAFQIRLHETPRMRTFAHAVRVFYNDPNSKLRGLCAENLVSVLLNANDKRRLELTAAFETELRFWLKDEDCWVLEHVHRFFHALWQRDKDMLRNEKLAALVGDASRLCDGLGDWWNKDRETFLQHIEERKQELRTV